jgi:hypothetical protein
MAGSSKAVLQGTPLRIGHAHPGFPNRALLAQLGPPPDFARLLVVFSFPQFFLQAASFKKFLETAQGQPDWFAIVNTHPQGHTFSHYSLPGKTGKIHLE